MGNEVGMQAISTRHKKYDSSFFQLITLTADDEDTFVAIPLILAAFTSLDWSRWQTAGRSKQRGPLRKGALQSHHHRRDS